jgi:hypothetical protein
VALPLLLLLERINLQALMEMMLLRNVGMSPNYTALQPKRTELFMAVKASCRSQMGKKLILKVKGLSPVRVRFLCV